ncbi:MAG TPA: hypothetical protein VHQ95_12035 [Pyrinomonadaceae bacterium]|nr:hypothetical protein [Pyrinomonadaceae bacterium]
MLAILFLCGSTVLGVCLVRLALRDLLDGIEQVLWGTVIGWVIATLGVYFVARWQGQLISRTVLWTTLAIWIIAAILFVICRAGLNLKALFEGRGAYIGLAVVLLVLAPIYWRLLSVQMFPRGEGGLYSGSAGNDLNFHAALISSFRYGQNFPPTYTLLPPERLSYPFLPDFHAAVLMAGGLSLRSAMIVTALILGAVIAGLLYALALRITCSSRTATLATLLFLLNGGLGFIYFFRDWWQSRRSFIQFWNTLSFNYANLSERGINWNNIVADIMVPQRTSLFGLSIGLMIFTIFAIVWQRWHASEGTETTQRQPHSLTLMVIAGMLAGSLPYFHTHTYIAAGFVSVILFAMRPRREWIGFWAPAVLLATPQIFWLALHARGGPGIVRVFFGWLGHEEPFFPLYLLRNFGLPLLFAVPAWRVAPREWRTFYLAFLLLFIFTFVIVFSPNLFDNGKLLYYWHALNSVLVAAWLVRLATAHKQRVLAIVLAFLSIATALIVFRHETIASTRMFTDEELTAAAFVREQTGPHALFLTAPELNSPVLSLGGRPVLRSATPWLWSHGYEFRQRESDVRRIYAGTVDAAELLRFYHVDYVYLGDAERSDVKANDAFFDANLPAIYHSQTITIYDARKLRDPSTEGSSPVSQRDIASRLDRDPYAMLGGFEDTSFFVYRLCKASYGRMPRREEFMSAMRLLGRDLVYGSSLWETQLHRNRAALLKEWTISPEFKRLYEGKSNAELVDTLLKNAGISWSASKRDELVNSLTTQTDPHQAALLSVISDSAFSASEYNNAYVLAHFFGYLRRNPDDAPDFDLKGFNFWRDRLNSWGDYRTISMAFMESEEYRNLKPAP